MFQKPYQLYLITIAVIIAIFVSTWTVHSRIQAKIEQSAGDSLTTVLNTAHQAVIRWVEREQAVVETWSDNLNIRHAADALLAVKPNQESLLSSPAQQALRDQLLPILMVKGYRGYFVIGKDHINLASSRDVNVGTKSLLADRTVFLDRIWSGNSAVSEPVLSDVPLMEQNTGGRERNTSMFVGAPILNNDYEVVAVFVFRIDPHRDFTGILQQARIGETGETYAFNQKAEMVSLSRFDEQLHQMGLIAGDGSEPSHRLTIRDPGSNLLAGEVSLIARAEQPLTYMAQQALQKHDGMNLKGYRDYRGVMVMGSWLWDEPLQMGFTTEIDADEANAIARYTDYALAVLSLITTVLLLLLMTVLDRGRRAMARQSMELRTIIDGSPVAMVLTDNVGNIEFFNRRFIEQFGWTINDVRTPEQWWQAAYPDPDYRQQVQQEWEQAVADAQEQSQEIAPQHWSLTCKNGTYRDVEFRMVPVSESISVIALLDLTERNRALRTIRYERDRAQGYLDTVDVMILALDSNGIITQINQAGCELLGYEEEELIGRNWFDTCLPPEERQRLMEEVHAPAMVQSEDGSGYVENEVLSRSGERRLIAWRNAPLSDDEGNIVGSLSAGADVTEIRAAEEERTQLFEQLQRTQKAEAIGQLSAGVSHNFNNMFGSIIGFLGLAKRKAEGTGDEDMKRYLSEALDSSYRARDLVAQIASFSRKSVADIRPHELDSVLLKSLELLNNILPSTIEIKANLSHDLPQASLDDEQFQQVLANVFSNASDAMAGSGVVEITSRLESVQENSCTSCHETYAGDYVVVDIRDSGHGMEQQVIERIFDPFYSTRDVGQGTGMGLPVVHGIMHNLAGHIQVESTPGAGTVVSLYLPVATTVV